MKLEESTLIKISEKIADFYSFTGLNYHTYIYPKNYQLEIRIDLFDDKNHFLVRIIDEYGNVLSRALINDIPYLPKNYTKETKISFINLNASDEEKFQYSTVFSDVDWYCTEILEYCYMVKISLDITH